MAQYASSFTVRQKPKDGNPGTSPILCDLTNEMDSVACDSDGNPITTGNANVKSTTVVLYKGSTLDTSTYKLTIGSAAQSSADVTTATTCATGITYKRTGNALSFTVGNTALDSTSITITAESANDSSVKGTCTFTIVKVKPGKNGDDGIDAEVYNINVDADAIARSEAGSNTPSSLTVYINKTKGATTEQIAPSSSTFLYYAKNGAATKAKLTSATLSVSDITSKVELFLYNKAHDATGAVLLDKETICIVKDGSNGSDSPQPNLFGYACPITCTPLAVAHTASGLAAWIVKAAGTAKNYDIAIGNINVSANRKLSIHMSAFSKSAATLYACLVYSDGTKSDYVSQPLNANTETNWTAYSKYQLDKSVTGIEFRISLAAATVMSGMFRISNLKIEDSTNLLGNSTPYNGLAVQQLSVRPNIIPDTQFTKKSKWKTFAGTTLSKDYMGLNVFQGDEKTIAKGENFNYLEMDLSGILKPNTFYTLSFWAKASEDYDNTRIDAYIYPNTTSPSLICVKDGAPGQAYSENATLIESHPVSTWKRKVTTFRTPSTLPSTYTIFWRIANQDPSSSFARRLYIAQPKLEEGDYATDYCQSEEDKHGTRGAFSILKWSEIAHGYHFYDAKAVGDMEIADVVIDDVTLGSNGKPLNEKYICIKEHIYDSEEYTKPSAKVGIYWQQMEKFDNIATDLLVSDQIYARVLQAVNARIDNLILNRAQATDAEGNITVSIDGTTGELEATGKITAKMFLSAVKSVSEKNQVDETLVIDPDTDGVSLYNIEKINDKTLTIQLPCLSKYEGLKLTFNRNSYGKVRFVQDNGEKICSPSVVSGYIKASWTFGEYMYMPANSNVTLQYLGSWTVINGWLSTNSTL